MPIEANNSINFISEEHKAAQKSKVWEVFLSWSSNTGKHILVAIETIVLLCLAADFYLSRNINLINNEISDLNLALNQVESQNIIKLHKEYQRDLLILEQNINAQIDWGTKLNKLNEKVPENMILKYINHEVGKITLSGTVDTPQGFGTFIEKLINDENVTEITLNRSVYDVKLKNFTFDLDMKVN